MVKVLNIIQSLTAGGAARTMIATAKYSSRSGPFQHRLATLDIQHSDAAAARFALENGIDLVPARTPEELATQIADADIVQVNWWQHPSMDLFLRSNFPPCRLLGWFHVAGDFAPQVLTDQLVSFFDLVLGGSPYTYEAPSIQRLPPEERERKCGYVTGGADFERLKNFAPLPHQGFKVGYIGTVNPIKMHPNFIEMHVGLKIPELEVIVCGGDQQELLQGQAEGLGIANLFSFPGYVDDIASVLQVCDVYGYPLCEDTYAASELNLQEAMFAGIPPVVFPHGGIKRLVIHGETGLVARSESEYREHLEFLYHHPEERARLGNNARAFAEANFGAERNAPRMNLFYDRLMKQEKRQHIWSGYLAPGIPQPSESGAQIFLESLGGMAPQFETSFRGAELEATLQAEEAIVRGSPLMRLGGVLPYHGSFPSDPYLNLWAGLIRFGAKQYVEATGPLLYALQHGVGANSWRALWYLSLIAIACEDRDATKTLLEQLNQLAPEFQRGRELLQQVTNQKLKLTVPSVTNPVFETE